MLRSARDLSNPSSRRQFASNSSNMRPEKQRPYNALSIRSSLHASFSNSGPALIHPFSKVFASRYTLPISVAHGVILLCSPRKIYVRSPCKDTTPELMESVGVGVRSPRATIRTLCLKSCLTS